jgi:hypothetical protein
MPPLRRDGCRSTGYPPAIVHGVNYPAQGGPARTGWLPRCVGREQAGLMTHTRARSETHPIFDSWMMFLETLYKRAERDRLLRLAKSLDRRFVVVLLIDARSISTPYFYMLHAFHSGWEAWSLCRP